MNINNEILDNIIHELLYVRRALKDIKKDYFINKESNKLDFCILSLAQIRNKIVENLIDNEKKEG